MVVSFRQRKIVRARERGSHLHKSESGVDRPLRGNRYLCCCTRAVPPLLAPSRSPQPPGHPPTTATMASAGSDTFVVKYRGFVHIDKPSGGLPEPGAVQKAAKLLKSGQKTARAMHPLFARGLDTQLNLQVRRHATAAVPGNGSPRRLMATRAARASWASWASWQYAHRN